MFDLKEQVTQKELNVRLTFRPQPNIIGFSLYSRKCDDGTNHLSIVENTIWKPNVGTWRNWWSDWNDRRDLSRYLRHRWLMN